MCTRGLTVRTAGLVATGALAVHELRYLIAGGSHGGSSGGHGYLPLLGLISALLLGVAAAQVVERVGGARATGADERSGPGLLGGWLLMGVSIAVVFSVQELLEAAVAGGRPAGLDTVVGAGGWVAFPLSAGVGAVLALTLVGARAAVHAAARSARRAVARRLQAPRRELPRAHRPARGVLARHLAGRAPPLAS